MQVFDISSGTPVLIGRVEKAGFDTEGDPELIQVNMDSVPRAQTVRLVVEGWLPMTAVDPVQRPRTFLPRGPSDREVEQLKNILAMLVERNGGAVHVDASDVIVPRILTIMQQQDPWGIILTTEGQ